MTDIRPQFNWYEVKQQLPAPEESADAPNSVPMEDILPATLIDVLSNPFRAGIIIRIFVEHSKFTYDELVSKRRFQDVANERQILMWILRKSLEASNPRIGTLMGGRDHSTVIHAIRKVQANEKMLERALDVMSAIWRYERLKFRGDAT